MGVKTLHFSIGENFGSLITTIAQEHLLYTKNYDKAINTIKQSLIGITEEQSLSILLGNAYLETDVKDQSTTLINKPSSKPLNLQKFVNNYFKRVESQSWDMIPQLKLFASRSYNKTYHVAFKFTDIKEYFLENKLDSVLEEFEGEEDVVNDKRYLQAIINFMNDVVKNIQYYRSLEKMNLCKIPTDNNYSFIELTKAMQDVQFSVYKLEKEIEKFTMLDKYLEADKEIGDTIRKGISPVNIKNGWDAGWIAQDGTYYAMNGEIANMLHLNIANALVEAGIIPEDFGGYTTADSYLERTGWIKQHGPWILYDAYNNHEYDEELKDISVSKEQKQAVYELGQFCHSGRVKVGFKMEWMSAVRFPTITDVQFRMNYFKY